MKYFLIFLVFIGLPTSSFAFESFIVKDIKLEGLQRISVGTVFNYLPIKPGDKIDKAEVKNAISVLFKTGFFKDIHIEREGDVLVVFVAERSAINDIKFEGNDEVPTEQLDAALKQVGLVKGRVFNRSTLEGLEQELQRQYYSIGKYNVKIDVQQTQLERNRVDITIKFSEGESAEIYLINIVGNKFFSTEKLISQLSLAETSFFGSRNNYKKQQLAADLENLKSFYLDHGFINFNIESTQVSLGPQKESVYISINIKEGDLFTVRNVKLAGDLILPRKELDELISVKANDTFSRREVVESTKRLSDILSEHGYAFANVNMVPDVDEKQRAVGVTFFIDPGRRVYVKRINVSGNVKTQDKVIRREFRQLEGDWLSTKNVARSKTRLDRLGFFEEVGVETIRVPGTIDQVNLNYNVIEKPTGSLQAGLGYSDTQGAIVNLSVSQDNIFGTGQRIGLSLDNSTVTKQFGFNFVNPYYTEDGVSRGISLSYRTVNAAAADISNYSTDSYDASLYYGIPLSEYTNYRWGVRYDSTKITPSTVGTAQNILDFINSEGAENDTFQVFTGWTYDSRNRRVFASKGALTSLGAEIAVPGSDLEYYKVDFRNLNYFSISKNVTLATNLNLGYGKSFSGANSFPPYKNYFAGGSHSIRGYDSNSVGPKDELTKDPTGGSVKIVANVDLILPNPFVEKSASTRVSLFLDGGSVFKDESTINAEEFRYTGGVALIWITPVGAMRFNFSQALNKKPGDSTRSFQFTLGSPF